MGSVTGQLLFGSSHPYHVGIIPNILSSTLRNRARKNAAFPNHMFCSCLARSDLRIGKRCCPADLIRKAIEVWQETGRSGINDNLRTEGLASRGLSLLKQGEALNLHKSVQSDTASSLSCCGIN